MRERERKSEREKRELRGFFFKVFFCHGSSVSQSMFMRERERERERKIHILFTEEEKPSITNTSEVHARETQRV